MHKGRILFTQIMDYLSYDVFDHYVKKYRGDYKNKSFSCRDQFLAMAFAQLTLRTSLRGIESTLRANRQLLYHMGFRPLIPAPSEPSIFRYPRKAPSSFLGRRLARSG